MDTACTLCVFGARGSNAEMDSGGRLLHARAFYHCLLNVFQRMALPTAWDMARAVQLSGSFSITNAHWQM